MKYDTARRYHRDRQASADYLARVAGTFDVELRWLITGEGVMDLEEERAREEEAEAARIADRILSAGFAAGVQEGFGSGSDRVLAPGVRRAALLHTWRRLTHLPAAEGTLDEENPRLGRAIGEWLRRPLDELGVDPSDVADDRLSDYVSACCAALGHLTRGEG